MGIALYIEDLHKALVTPPPSAAPKPPSIGAEAGGAKPPDPRRKLSAGAEYEYAGRGAQPPGDGWERTSGEGWRRPIGSGGGKDKKVDTTGGETPEDQAKQASAGRTGTSDPFSPNPEDFASDDALEHYRHIQAHTAQEGTDPKLTQMHRELINEKTKDFTADDHQNLSDQLRGADMEAEGAKHQAVADSVGANEQQTGGPASPAARSTYTRLDLTGEAKLKERAAETKELKETEAVDRKVTAAEARHRAAKEAHAEHSKAAEEAGKAHEASTKYVTETKEKLEAAEKEHQAAAHGVASAAQTLQRVEKEAKFSYDKELDNKVSRAEDAQNTANKKAGSTGLHGKKNEKVVATIHSEVERLQTDVNSNSRKNLSLQEKKRAHKDYTPKHKDFGSTEAYQAAKAQHKLKGDALHAQISELSSKNKETKQALKEMREKRTKAQAKLKAAKAKHAAAMSAHKGARAAHEGLKKQKAGKKVPETTSIAIAKKKAQAAADTFKDKDAKHKEAKKEHQKALKAHGATKTKHEAATAKAKKAEEAIGPAAQGVEDSKAAAAQRAQASEDKKAEQVKKVQDKRPGILSGIRGGFHTGRAVGAAIGGAAARPEGAGAVASSTINYGTSGAVTMGHYLLYPNSRRALGTRTRPVSSSRSR